MIAYHKFIFQALHLANYDLKGLPGGVRVNSDMPSKVNVNIKNHQAKPVRYTLLSIPFYLLGQLHRLLN